MKARNREINIFNMSLLDILCGALGTFCFLMLVLFPYYSIGKNAKQAPEIPPGVDPKTLEEAKARIQQLEETLKKFQSFAQDTQNQATQAQAQAQQLQAQNAQLRDQNARLKFRNPFLAQADFQLASGDQAQVAEEDDRESDDSKVKIPKLDPNKIQGNAFKGDLVVIGDRSSYWLVRDGPTGSYKFFFKVVKHDVSKGPLVVGGSILSSDGFKVIPQFIVAQERAMVPLGTVTTSRGKDGDYVTKIDIDVPKEFQQAPGSNGGPSGAPGGGGAQK
jgi:hypothetical protein